MKMTLGLGLSQNTAGAVSASGPTITTPGSIDVSTFKIGTTQTITAGTATATGGGTVTYEVRHLSNGEVKSTSAAYAHVAADDTESGVAQWRAVETGGTNPGATSWQTVATGTITEQAPSNTVAPAVSGSTGLGDILSVTQGTWTGGGITYSYQWQRNGSDISGATASSYMIVQADDAASIRCVVTATNSGDAVSANSNAVTVDDFAAPSITGVPTISGTETQGSILTASAASTAGNPTPSRSWQWERNGSPISGATSATYTLQAADVGATLTVVQSETNTFGSDSAESAATGVISAGNSAPVISGVPTISGTATDGQTLTATAASVSGNPTPTRTWQWKRGGANISGATNSTYVLQAADIGSTITVEQTETNVAGSDSATSAATATVTGQQIAITSGPTFNGTDTISMSVNRAGTVYWMITSNATETAAAIIAGTGAIDSGSFAVTSGSNNDSIAYPNVPAGDYYLHIVADAATSPSPSSVDSTQYTFPSGDTTAPILSSATDAANGQTASTGSVSTDEGNGTLYWVVTTSATAPSAAQVKAGQDNTGTAADGDSGSQSVSATGVQNITPSGLTASTAYTTHFMHEDAASNQSTVASASGFTTASASGIAYVAQSTPPNDDTHPAASPLTLSYTPTASGNVLVLIAHIESAGTSRDTSIDAAGGQLPTWNSNTMQFGALGQSSRRHVGIYGLQAGTTSSADFSIAPTNGMRGASLICLEYSGVDTTTIFNALGTAFSTGDTITPALTTVDAGGHLVGAATWDAEGTASTVLTGTLRSEGASGAVAKDIRRIVADIAVASAGASENVSFNQTGNLSATAAIVELNPA
jgi:hypothetical protein